MREIRFRAWNKVDKTMYENAIYNCKDTFDMILKHPQIYEVMQYTGLKDKNGTEIYEGDIVAQFNFEDKFFRTKVVYKNGSFGYINPLFNEFISYDSNIAFKWKNGRSKNIEVIGNIYEDPELLQCVEKI